MAGGIAYLSQSDFDQWAAKTTGMDPFIVLGLSTFGFMGIGWLLGPIVGAPVFNAMYRGVMPEFRAVSAGSSDKRFITDWLA